MVESHNRYKAQVKYNQIEPEIRDSNAVKSREPNVSDAATAAAAPTTTSREAPKESAESSNDVSGSVETSASVQSQEKEVPSNQDKDTTTDATPTENETKSETGTGEKEVEQKAAIRRAANLNDNSLVGCLPSSAAAAGPPPEIMTSIDRKNNDIAKPVAKVRLYWRL